MDNGHRRRDEGLGDGNGLGRSAANAVGQPSHHVDWIGWVGNRGSVRVCRNGRANASNMPRGGDRYASIAIQSTGDSTVGAALESASLRRSRLPTKGTMEEHELAGTCSYSSTVFLRRAISYLSYRQHPRANQICKPRPLFSIQQSMDLPKRFDQSLAQPCGAGDPPITG